MADFSLLSDAIVCDNGKFDVLNKFFNGGVISESGKVCELSIHFKPGYKNLPSISENKRISSVKGVWIFGGMLQNGHFGHFITESLNRLWLVTNLKEFDGVVFYSRYCGEPNKEFVLRFLELILPGVMIKIIDRPCSVETLYVPEQLHCGNGFISGDPQIKKFFSRVRVERTQTYDLVYVTRSDLKRGEGNIIGNSELSKIFKKEGYEVIYPEKLSLEEQISIYKNAKKLVFDQGSAFHLYNLFGNDLQSVYVIWRRKKVVNGYVAQYRSFFKKNLNSKSFIKKQLVPVGFDDNTAKYFGLPNYCLLFEDLFSLGFIEDIPDLKDLEDDERMMSDFRRTFGEFKEV